MPFVVTQPFADHTKGERLTDKDAEPLIEAGQDAFLVRVAPEPEPEVAEPEKKPPLAMILPAAAPPA